MSVNLLIRKTGCIDVIFPTTPFVSLKQIEGKFDIEILLLLLAIVTKKNVNFTLIT